MTLAQKFYDARKEGFEIGFKIGFKIGESRLAKLFELLIGQQRYEDANAAAKNADVREKLYQEFGL